MTDAELAEIEKACAEATPKLSALVAEVRRLRTRLEYADLELDCRVQLLASNIGLGDYYGDHPLTERERKLMAAVHAARIEASQARVAERSAALEAAAKVAEGFESAGPWLGPKPANVCDLDGLATDIATAIRALKG